MGDVMDVRFKTNDENVKERAIKAGFNVVEMRGLKRGNMVLGKEYVFDVPDNEVRKALNLSFPVEERKADIDKEEKKKK